MEHPIAPPPELVSDWAHMLEQHTDTEVFTQAARWGADQELEACCEWLAQETPEPYISALRAARRPKPLSLKEQALAALKRQAVRSVPSLIATEDCDTIRLALEQLDD